MYIHKRLIWVLLVSLATIFADGTVQDPADRESVNGASNIQATNSAPSGNSGVSGNRIAEEGNESYGGADVHVQTPGQDTLQQHYSGSISDDYAHSGYGQRQPGSPFWDLDSRLLDDQSGSFQESQNSTNGFQMSDRDSPKSSVHSRKSTSRSPVLYHLMCRSSDCNEKCHCSTKGLLDCKDEDNNFTLFLRHLCVPHCQCNKQSPQLNASLLVRSDESLSQIQENTLTDPTVESSIANISGFINHSSVSESTLKSGHLLQATYMSNISSSEPAQGDIQERGASRRVSIHHMVRTAIKYRIWCDRTEELTIASGLCMNYSSCGLDNPALRCNSNKPTDKREYLPRKPDAMSFEQLYTICKQKCSCRQVDRDADTIGDYIDLMRAWKLKKAATSRADILQEDINSPNSEIQASGSRAGTSRSGPGSPTTRISSSKSGQTISHIERRFLKHVASSNIEDKSTSGGSLARQSDSSISRSSKSEEAPRDGRSSPTQSGQSNGGSSTGVSRYSNNSDRSSYVESGSDSGLTDSSRSYNLVSKSSVHAEMSSATSKMASFTLKCHTEACQDVCRCSENGHVKFLVLEITPPRLIEKCPILCRCRRFEGLEDRRRHLPHRLGLTQTDKKKHTMSSPQASAKQRSSEIHTESVYPVILRRASPPRNLRHIENLRIDDRNSASLDIGKYPAVDSHMDENSQSTEHWVESDTSDNEMTSRDHTGVFSILTCADVNCRRHCTCNKRGKIGCTSLKVIHDKPEQSPRHINWAGKLSTAYCQIHCKCAAVTPALSTHSNNLHKTNMVMSSEKKSYKVARRSEKLNSSKLSVSLPASTVNTDHEWSTSTPSETSDSNPSTETPQSTSQISMGIQEHGPSQDERGSYALECGKDICQEYCRCDEKGIVQCLETINRFSTKHLTLLCREEAKGCTCSLDDIALSGVELENNNAEVKQIEKVSTKFDKRTLEEDSLAKTTLYQDVSPENRIPNFESKLEHWISSLHFSQDPSTVSESSSLGTKTSSDASREVKSSLNKRDATDNLKCVSNGEVSQLCQEHCQCDANREVKCIPFDSPRKNLEGALLFAPERKVSKGAFLFPSETTTLRCRAVGCKCVEDGLESSKSTEVSPETTSMSIMSGPLIEMPKLVPRVDRQDSHPEPSSPNSASYSRSPDTASEPKDSISNLAKDLGPTAPLKSSSSLDPSSFGSRTSSESSHEVESMKRKEDGPYALKCVFQESPPQAIISVGITPQICEEICRCDSKGKIRCLRFESPRFKLRGAWVRPLTSSETTSRCREARIGCRCFENSSRSSGIAHKTTNTIRTTGMEGPSTITSKLSPRNDDQEDPPTDYASYLRRPLSLSTSAYADISEPDSPSASSSPRRPIHVHVSPLTSNSIRSSSPSSSLGLSSLSAETPPTNRSGLWTLDCDSSEPCDDNCRCFHDGQVHCNPFVVHGLRLRTKSLATAFCRSSCVCVKKGDVSPAVPRAPVKAPKTQNSQSEGGSDEPPKRDSKRRKTGKPRQSHFDRSIHDEKSSAESSHLLSPRSPMYRRPDSATAAHIKSDTDNALTYSIRCSTMHPKSLWDCSKLCTCSSKGALICEEYVNLKIRLKYSKERMHVFCSEECSCLGSVNDVGMTSGADDSGTNDIMETTRGLRLRKPPHMEKKPSLQKLSPVLEETPTGEDSSNGEGQDGLMRRSGPMKRSIEGEEKYEQYLLGSPATRAIVETGYGSPARTVIKTRYVAPQVGNSIAKFVSIRTSGGDDRIFKGRIVTADSDRLRPRPAEVVGEFSPDDGKEAGSSPGGRGAAEAHGAAKARGAAESRGTGRVPKSRKKVKSPFGSDSASETHGTTRSGRPYHLHTTPEEAIKDHGQLHDQAGSEDGNQESTQLQSRMNHERGCTGRGPSERGAHRSRPVLEAIENSEHLHDQARSSESFRKAAQLQNRGTRSVRISKKKIEKVSRRPTLSPIHEDAVYEKDDFKLNHYGASAASKSDHEEVEVPGEKDEYDDYIDDEIRNELEAEE